MLTGADRGTISVGLVRQALLVAAHRHIPVNLLLSEAGIGADVSEGQRARVSAQAYARLWALLADAMDDEFFGMDAHPMRRGSYRLMCQAALGGQTLEQALVRMIGFLRLVLDDLQGGLQREGDRVVLQLGHAGPPQRMFAYATWLMLVHGLACWLVGRRLPLLSAEFRCPVPDDPAELADYRVRFCSTLSFDQPHTRVWLESRWLALPIIQSEATLPDFLRSAPACLLVRYRNDASLSAQIRRRLRRLAPADWPDVDSLARSLHLSSTTLQRRLQAEGLSYQALRDALRRDLAIDLLGQAQHPVAEVAVRLGFNEPSAFQRAFKKWTGVSPGAYRRTGLDTPVQSPHAD